MKLSLHRFCWPVGSIPLTELHREYANAMCPVYQRLGENDPEIIAMFAESLMMLAPWKLWTAPPDVKPAIPETEELVMLLEKALEKHPTHPALCHFYVHTMELSSTPEKALPAADVLRTRIPGNGHLLHMPSHIDMRMGEYKKAIKINKKAAIADETFTLMSGQESYKLYQMHKYHFTVWAAMFDGQFSTAMQYAEAAKRHLGPDTVSFKLGDMSFGATYLESYASIPWHVLIRFGKWEEIINRPLKEDKDLYAGTVAVSHYARGVAFAVTGKTEEAEVERKRFYSALENKALEGRQLHNNAMHDPDHEHHSGILDIAEAVLNGEVEYFKGNIQQGFQHLRLAVQRDISLKYNEPWGWMMPARHVLGALLLEQGEAVEAEAVYREDL